MKAERHFEGQPVELEIAAPSGNVDSYHEAGPTFEALALPARLALGHPKTKQDIFDIVVRHHRKQRTRCPPEGVCFYRFGGDMCFVGALMSDDEVAHLGDNAPIRMLIRRGVAPIWMNGHVDFLYDLQMIHDQESNWPADRMDMVLEMFAKDRGLSMPA